MKPETRVLSAILALLMCLSLLPLAALADEEPLDEEIVLEEVFEEEAPSEEPTEESVEEPAEEPAEEPIEEPVEEPVEEPAEEPVEEPVEEPEEEPEEEPVEEPVEEPAEEPVEEPIEEPAEEPIEEPVEEPAEEPAEEPVEEPAEEPVEEPAEEPVEEPVEEPAEEPIEEPAEEPIEEPAEEPVEEPAEEPIEEPVEEPVEEPAEEPAEEPVEEPAEEPVEEPAEEPVEEPAEEPVEEPVEEPAEDEAEEPVLDGILLGGTYDTANCTTITAETVKTVNITSSATYVVYKFVPTQTRKYAFRSYSRNGIDPKAYLYDAGGTQMASNDDIDGGTYEFMIERELTAGTIYFYVVTRVGNTSTGSCAVQLTTKAGFCGINAYWVLRSDGELRISGSGAMANYDSQWPGYYEFKDSIQRLYVDPGITSIGMEAFRDLTSLTEAYIDYGVTSIGSCAFQDCTALNFIRFYCDAPSFGSDCFYGVEAAAIYDPGKTGWTGSVLQDYGGTIFWCNGQCGDNVFWTVEGSKLIIAGSGPMWDFDGSNNPGWYKTDGSLSITSIEIRIGVTAIGKNAFNYLYDNDTVTSVSIPGSVTSIGTNAFFNCSGLTGITLPYGVTAIGYQAFAYCDALTSVTLPDSLTVIGELAFFSCAGLTSVTIPNSVTAIGEYAFAYCDNLTSATIGTVVTVIPARAFYGCNRLSSVTLPAGLTSIENAAFYQCSSLSSITLPSSLVSIGDNAFCNTGLRNVVIPAGVTYIGAAAFSHNSYLTSIAVTAGNPAYAAENGVLLSADKKTLVCCPGGKSGSYTIPSTVTAIADNAFDSCAMLTAVTIPSSVKAIGHYAFHGCSKLTSIAIPNGVTNIGRYTLSDCDSLTSVTIPSSVTVIEQSAFYDSDALTTVTLPSSVKTIEGSAFFSCSKLASIAIPNGVTAIASSTFYECSSLTSVTIPAGVTAIGDSAFYNCSALVSVTIPASVTSIGQYAFCRCSSLTGITIPAGVTAIARSTFASCSSLASVTLPASATSIGEYAFNNCSSLTSVTIPAGVTSIGGAAFSRCTSLTGVTIPAGVTSIGDAAFYGCTSLTEIFFTGNAPAFSGNTIFTGDTLTAVYPKGNATWTSDVMQNYGGGVTWQPQLPAPAVQSVAMLPSGMKVTWSKVTGAAKYQVYRRVSGTANWTAVGSPTTGNTYSDTSSALTSGKVYFYTVRAMNASDVPSMLSAGKYATYLKAPEVSSVSALTNGLKVSWGAVGGAAKYQVYRRMSGVASWTSLGYTTATSYSDTSSELVSGKVYFYTIRAVNSSGKTSTLITENNKYNTYLKAPIVSSVTIQTTGLKVTWGAVGGASKYQVYRRAQGTSTWSKVGPETTATNYTDTSVESGKIYFYTVRAINSSGRTSTIITTDNKYQKFLLAPVISSLKKVSGGIQINWGAVTGATYYKLYRHVEGVSTWTEIASTSNKTFTDKNVTSGTKYYYTVRALEGNGRMSTLNASKSITY